MSILKITWRFIWIRPWLTLSTLFALILPTLLTVLILVVKAQTEGALRRDAGHYDLVVGAKGGALQLVMSSIYHIGMPNGNIAYREYEEVKADPRVKHAIPIGLGDNYEGFRIVGTSPDFLSVRGGEGDFLHRLREGRVFGPDSFDAVIGAQVARQTGLKIGTRFCGTHGLMKLAGAEVHQQFVYEVAGILEPTGNASDQAIYVPLSAIWKVHHVDDTTHQVFGQHVKSQREVTSVLLQLHSPGARLWMQGQLRKKPHVMASVPINEALTLSKIYLEPFQKLLLLVTVGVVSVSCLVVLITLFQAVERREGSLKILRSLGATRSEIARTIFYELTFTILVSITSGCVLAHGALFLFQERIYQSTGMLLNPWQFVSGELSVLLGFAVFLFCIGVLPLRKIYSQSALE